MTVHPLFGLALWLGLCLAVMGTGALFRTPAIPGWYSGLKKPVWTPPSWLFGPVWFILYILMALAAWLVWQQETLPRSHWPLIVFVIQLGLNLGWSYIFFSLEKPGLALGEIVLLWSAILITVTFFWPINRFAGFLLLPYFIWVSFDAFLNFFIWRLNRF